MKTTRRVSRALLGALIAVSVVIAVQPAWAQVTFSDSTFSDADWELITVWVIGGTSSTVQVAAGGNPGLFREIRNNSRRGDGEIWAFHRKIGATYDPRVEGEISSIDYSEDAILISGFGQGQATGPVLQQDGKVYVGALTTLLLTPDFSWVTKVLNGLTQDNFFLLTSSGFVISGHPDFSANGSPIEFGFLRAHSRSGTIVGGIDNWSMTITSMPSPPLLPPEPCVLPPPGLVSWWPGDGNFTDIQDGNNGTPSGGVTFVTGEVGQAFNFDSTSFIRIANSANLQPEQITLDGWIKPVFAGRPAQSADADIILEKLDSSLNGYALAIAMDPTFPFLQAPAGGVPLGTPVFLLNVSGGANQIFGSSPLPNDGLYHHVAGTYDGATMRLFLDGVEVASRSVIGSIVHAAAADALIGGESAFPRNSRAAIDEVEIFNRALDASEIQGIFNAASAGKCKPGACIPPPPGLVSWWDGDAVFGTTAEDIQDGNHGILTNGATTAPGQVGEAFSFDGVNDFVEVPNVTNLNPSRMGTLGHFSMVLRPLLAELDKHLVLMVWMILWR